MVKGKRVRLQYGDRVRVQFGPRLTEGEVVEAYGAGSHAHVRVAILAIEPVDPDDPFTVTYPRDQVELIEPARARRRAG